MRLAYHIEVSKKAYILLFITAILHLFSIVFKQLVIQQVHTMRNLDQNISYNTIKVQTLRSNNEFLNDLHLIYYLNSANFLSELNEYSLTLVNLNSNNKDFPEKKVDEAREYYFNKLQNLYKKNNFYEYDNLYLLQDLFENDEFFKSTDAFKKLRPLYEDLKNEVNKKKTNLFTKFNKNTKSQEERSENFEIYKDVYRYYSSFGSDVENFYEEIRKDLHKDLLRQFIKQYSFIDKYNDNKNLKNYYLILSILFQILGLTFLLLLFKELINIFKVKNIK
jgi:hypothetical protein